MAKLRSLDYEDENDPGGRLETIAGVMYSTRAQTHWSVAMRMVPVSPEPEVYRLSAEPLKPLDTLEAKFGALLPIQREFPGIDAGHGRDRRGEADDDEGEDEEDG